MSNNTEKLKNNFIKRVILASKEEPRIAIVLLAGILCGLSLLLDLLKLKF